LSLNRSPQLRSPAERRLAAALERASLAPIGFGAPCGQARRRSCRLERGKARVAHLPRFEPKNLGMAGINAIGHPGVSKVSLMPCAGERRQAAVSVNFRPAAAGPRELPDWRPAPAMIWPRELWDGFPAGVSLPAKVRAAERRLSVGAARWPVSPGPADIHQLVGPEFLSTRSHQRDCQMDGRLAEVVWRLAECEALPPALDWRPLASPSWSGGPRRLRLLAPLAPHGVPQLALVPIEPQQTAFEYAPIRLEVAPASVPETPVRAAAYARTCLEEDFDAGLENWEGDLERWKVDAAGARCGGLAWFTPSTQWADYEFEFLARVEGQSLTWVFRAAAMGDYHAACLTMEGDGEVAFHRWSVIGGAAGARFSKPLAIRLRESKPAGRSKSPSKAIIVLTRVQGKRFSVSVDGQTVDQWADHRLSAGGIGFASAPEDRARIYWVRLTALGARGKENYRA
jgi:hypothetical protein